MITKIALDLEDFQCLVRGGQLDLVDGKGDAAVSVILKDIGFIQMYDAIKKAEDGEAYKGLRRPLK